MSQILELPDKIYEALTAAAREDGLSPAEWLALRLHIEAPGQERPLAELTAGLTGVIDSTEAQGTQRTAFGTALAEKFRKQGLRTP